MRKPLGSPVGLWVLAKFVKFNKKSPEALRCNVSGDFYDSSLHYATRFTDTHDLYFFS